MTEEATEQLSKKDFATGQSERWCPGCGDYAILSAMKNTLPQLGRKREDFTFISGIGCAARFPYYLNTYGFHTIHGRGPAVATGVKLANPELCVWEIQGDGDALAIGGNHFIHALRRNIDINILLFNNEIYGLTKGQYSPTSPKGLKTKSSPFGALEVPFNVGQLVIGSKGTFFARATDKNPKQMTEIFVEASKHKGTTLVEILQNCVIFNDKIHAEVTDKETAADKQLYLEHGKPMLFGKDMDKGIRLNGLNLEVVKIGKDGIGKNDILVHDAQVENPTLHGMLINMALPEFPLAVGIIRAVPMPTYDQMVYQQIAEAKSRAKIKNMDELLSSGQTWEIN